MQNYVYYIELKEPTGNRFKFQNSSVETFELQDGVIYVKTIKGSRYWFPLGNVVFWSLVDEKSTDPES